MINPLNPDDKFMHPGRIRLSLPAISCKECGIYNLIDKFTPAVYKDGKLLKDAVLVAYDSGGNRLSDVILSIQPETFYVYGEDIIMLEEAWEKPGFKGQGRQDLIQEILSLRSALLEEKENNQKREKKGWFSLRGQGPR